MSTTSLSTTSLRTTSPSRSTSTTARRPAPMRSTTSAQATSSRPAPGPTARRATATDAHVRLTRRGRLLVLLALVAVLLGAFSLGRSASLASSPSGASAAAVSSAEPVPALEQVTVQSGESLWTVAQRIAPDNDPRDVVAQIRRINDLSSAQLRPGQQLLLPVAA